MWTLSKRFSFEASHTLPHHDGKCRRLHGHSWGLVVVCQGETLQDVGAKSGMLMDYADIKGAVQPLLDTYLDHYHLNSTTRLHNPTSETLSRWVYDQLFGVLPDLYAITIEETCTSACTYCPADSALPR